MKEILHTNGKYIIIGETFEYVLKREIGIKIYVATQRWTGTYIANRDFIEHTLLPASKFHNWLFGTFESRVHRAVNSLKADVQRKREMDCTEECDSIMQSKSSKTILSKLSERPKVICVTDIQFVHSV